MPRVYRGAGATSKGARVAPIERVVYRFVVPRVVAALLFFMVVDEGDPTTLYARYMLAPFRWVHLLLFEPLPFKVRTFDVAMIAILWLASSRRSGKGPRVAPMRSALLVGVGTIVAWFLYGLARGGDARAASWQVYLMLSAILTTFTIATVCFAVEHLVLLGKAILAAGLYRAGMCWIFHFQYMSPPQLSPLPDYVTAHDDSVVWVICVVMLAVQALAKRRWRTTIFAMVAGAILLAAIHFNMRRLAWVSLTMAFGMLFFLLPNGAMRRRLLRLARFAVPILVLYVAVGWGRTEKIFKPLESLATVSTEENQSTKARNMENLGLIATVRDAGSLAGTGWGHKYIEVSNTYSIAEYFELWPYIPHNSVLGLLAYTGILGFAGYWLAFPTAIFFNSRIAKLGNTEAVRSVGMVGSAATVACAGQMYGDMGVFSLRTMYLLAAAYAVAVRLPILAGVWVPRTKGAPGEVTQGEPAWKS
jgi:hypothetical protein